MSAVSNIPRIVPDFDVTVHIVLDDFGKAGRSCYAGKMRRPQIGPRQPLMTAIECREYAIGAGTAAQAEPNAKRRDILYRIARTWESLAEQTEKVEKLTSGDD